MKCIPQIPQSVRSLKMWWKRQRLLSRIGCGQIWWIKWMNGWRSLLQGWFWWYVKSWILSLEWSCPFMSFSVKKSSCARQRSSFMQFSDRQRRTWFCMSEAKVMRFLVDLLLVRSLILQLLEYFALSGCRF